MTQPRVSDLMRGRIDLFNAEMLIDMLSRFGIRTKVVLEPRRRRAGVSPDVGFSAASAIGTGGRVWARGGA